MTARPAKDFDGAVLPPRRRHARLILLLAVGAACSDSPVEPRAPAGSILYTAYARGESNIVALDVGKAIPRRLTTSGSAAEPKWSQDGRWIVFLDLGVASAGSVKSLQVFVMRADGSGARQITHDTGRVEMPAISPDGRQVAYECAGQESRSRFFICLTAVDGGPSTVVTPSVPGLSPSWSPDGSRIAFSCEQANAAVRNLCTVSPNGTGVSVVSPDSINVRSVAWSPDGSHFAISAAPPRSERFTLYTVSADGRQVRRVFDEPTPLAFRDTPTWSADQSQFAFVRYDEQGLAKIYVVSANGTGERPLVNDTAEQWDPSWSPTRDR